MPRADERIDRFETWAKSHGGSFRPGERRRIADDLLEIAGEEAVLEVDIETLVKRYKQGLAGAQRILAAQRIGAEFLDWQKADIDERRKSERPVSAKEDTPGPNVGSWRRKSREGAEGPLSRPPSSEVARAEEPIAQLPARDTTSVKPSVDMEVEAIEIAPRVRGNDAPPPSREDVFETVKAPPPSISRDHPPASAYPLGIAVTSAGGGPFSPRRIAVLGVAFGGLGLVVLLVFLMRPVFLFTGQSPIVAGIYKSKHLGLMMSFPGDWRHAEGLDQASRTRDGFDRKSAVFFVGNTDKDFDARIELVAITHPGEQVTDEIARNEGGQEALEIVDQRACDTLIRGATRGTKCMGFTSTVGDPVEYATFEAYFPQGSLVVYARGFVKVGPQNVDEGAKRTNEGLGNVKQRLGDIDRVVATIDALR